MATTATPTPTRADISFLRSMVPDAEEVKELRRQATRLQEFANRHVLAMRQRLAVRIVNALHQRYASYMKHEDSPPSFAVWLNGQKMEGTYRFHSLETRQYWSSRPIRLAAIERLSLDDTAGDASWYFTLFAELVNHKDPQGFLEITVTPSLSESRRYPQNPTILFGTTLKAKVS